LHFLNSAEPEAEHHERMKKRRKENGYTGMVVAAGPPACLPRVTIQKRRDLENGENDET
jgi:hypothetical protein